MFLMQDGLGCFVGRETKYTINYLGELAKKTTPKDCKGIVGCCVKVTDDAIRKIWGGGILGYLQ